MASPYLLIEEFELTGRKRCFILRHIWTKHLLQLHGFDFSAWKEKGNRVRSTRRFRTYIHEKPSQRVRRRFANISISVLGFKDVFGFAVHIQWIWGRQRGKGFIHQVSYGSKDSWLEGRQAGTWRCLILPGLFIISFSVMAMASFLRYILISIYINR